MKIENTLLNNLFQNNKIDFLKEGSIFKGKIIDIKDGKVIVKIPEFGLIEATLDFNSEIATGEQLLFLVKSVDKNKIYLKSLDNSHTGTSIYNKENPIVKFLIEIGIERNETSISLVEKLMEYNLPINEDTVNEGLKILEKLIQISNFTYDEDIILSDPNLIRDIENKDLERLDIKHLLFVDKDFDLPVDKNLSNKIKEIIRNALQLDEDIDLIKLTSFFVKNNMKPTLRNIKYINELDSNPMEFIKELQEIIHVANHENLHKINKKVRKKIDNSNRLEIVTTKEENINELEKILMQVVKDGKEDLENIRELENKLDFLRELNKELAFMFFPMDYGFKESLQGLVTFIKERKKRGIGSRLNILINLDTKNLGNISVFCTLAGEFLNIRMRIKEEDLELFKSTEEKLIEKILTIGYSVKGIEYIVDKKISIIDSQIIKPSSTYILDLKV